MSEEDGNPLNAIHRLVERFRIPLDKARAEVSEIPSEFEVIVSYATQFISLSIMDYQSVWWCLFHAPNSPEWSNLLTLSTLLFSLPVSNGKLERAFSRLNLIKSSKRNCLGSDTLSDLLVLNTNKVPLQNFSPDTSIDLWWNAKTRKPSHGPRTHYKKRTPRGLLSDISVAEEDSASEGDEDSEDQ